VAISEKNLEIKEVDPLGVLLALLEKEKLEISNFSLAKVADQYLEYLKTARDQNKFLENISEFIWVATRLALLKSETLLAAFSFEEEQQENVDDLKTRLLEYQKFKKITEDFKINIESSQEFISRKNKRFNSCDFSINFSKNDLSRAFREVARTYNLENKVLYIKKEIREIFKIEERIKQIENILNNVGRLKFSKIILNKNNRTEIIVSFLSILELVKQGTIRIKQEKSFQDMDIVKRS